MADGTNRQEVIVVDLKMSFWSMVVFMVKWAIAAIPAIIILTAIAALVAMVLGGVGTTLRVV
jgi:hypothetical protein